LLVCDACREKCRGENEGKGKQESKVVPASKEAKGDEEVEKQQEGEGEGGTKNKEKEESKRSVCSGGGEEVLKVSLSKLECEKCLKDPSWVDPLTYLPGNVPKVGGSGGNTSKNEKKKKMKKKKNEEEEGVIETKTEASAVAGEAAGGEEVDD